MISIACTSFSALHRKPVEITNFNIASFIRVKGKGKAVPLEAGSDPEVSRKLRFPDFVTTEQDGGKLCTGRLYPKEIFLVIISVKG